MSDVREKLKEYMGEEKFNKYFPPKKKKKPKNEKGNKPLHDPNAAGA